MTQYKCLRQHMTTMRRSHCLQQILLMKHLATSDMFQESCKSCTIVYFSFIVVVWTAFRGRNAG